MDTNDVYGNKKYKWERANIEGHTDADTNEKHWTTRTTGKAAHELLHFLCHFNPTDDAGKTTSTSCSDVSDVSYIMLFMIVLGFVCLHTS